jgi:uncharacterized protein (TIGR00369 family)
VRFPVRIPFVDKLGFELVEWQPGASEIAVELQPDLCNSWSVAHGGVLMTLLDVAMAHAARRSDPVATGEHSGVVTVEMKTTFMRPGIGRMLGRGSLLHRTASMAFCEATVVNPEGERVAHATGTFKYLKRLPVGRRVIHRDDASD